MSASFAMSLLFLAVLAAGCAFVFVGYPLLIGFFPRKAGERTEPPKRLLIVVPFHDRLEQVLKKLENLAESLKSLPEDISVLVIASSDGSAEDVNVEVEKNLSQNMSLRRFPRRVGKTAMINEIFSEADAGLFMVSDADVSFDSETLPRMIRAFEDPGVGAVTARRTVAQAAEKPALALSKLYLRWKAWLKDRETRSGLMIGLEGTGYMIRRELFLRVDDAAQDDLVMSLASLAAKKACLQLPDAKIYDRPATTNAREFARVRRIVNRAIHSLVVHRNLWLRLDRPEVILAVVSTKILKWILPTLALPMFLWALAGFAARYPYQACGFFVITAALAASAGLVAKGQMRRLLRMAGQILVTILGMAAGIFDYSTGIRRKAW